MKLCEMSHIIIFNIFYEFLNGKYNKHQLIYTSITWFISWGYVKFIRPFIQLVFVAIVFGSCRDLQQLNDSICINNSSSFSPFGHGCFRFLGLVSRVGWDSRTTSCGTGRCGFLRHVWCWICCRCWCCRHGRHWLLK